MQLFLAVSLLIIIEFYFYKRLTASLKTLLGSSAKIRTGSLVFLGIINLYPVYMLFSLLIVRLTHGSTYLQPQGGFFDYLIFFPFVILVLYIAQSLLFILPVDLLRLVISPFLKKHRQKVGLISAWTIVGISAAFFVYVPLRIIYDYKGIEVRQVELRKSGLPESLNNYKIAFIADVQADSYNNRKRLGKYMDRVNEAKPDLVLVGGDVITETPDYIDLAAEYLGDIKSRMGVFSCIGDHDHWAYKDDNSRSIRAVSTALHGKKVDMLDNQNRVFKAGESAIGVTFVTNTYVDRIAPDILKDLTKSNKGDVKILLTHQPSQYLVDRAKEENYDLFLAGHTHGGQITFLFPFHDLTFTQIETKYVKGDFHIGNMLMVVTRGLGMSSIPFRYNSTPEITVITLKKAS
ncbi:MAG: metallophosphoesterase [Ignavibacteria bacterium]|nr:metallophosphoesterase [Ignavibacteria bacterium]MCU7502179.1 metallophosphoesterase [Ignavibacteria bacterium]MCU7517396.1 metallophosphoesterase [Ignavibacteria bacterium]